VQAAGPDSQAGKRHACLPVARRETKKARETKLRSKQAPKSPMFNSAGEVTGENETAAMLEAVAKATTFERLLGIDKSRRLGFDMNRLTLDQARKIREAIDRREAELRGNGSTKAA
jgi:hypothetical protein